jgi:hypothetical protein
VLPENYNAAINNCSGIENITIKNVSSPDGLTNDVPENKNNVLFFLDAHWQTYWPILDELSVIEYKNIEPVIIVHDFFVPNSRGGAKFGFDTYKGQPLNINYISEALEKIYSKGYLFFYSDKVEVNSGLIYIHRKEHRWLY